MNYAFGVQAITGKRLLQYKGTVKTNAETLPGAILAIHTQRDQSIPP
jgi:hypothetical protein